MARPITIRRSLVLSFVLVVGLLTLVLLGTTWLTARSAAESQAARLIRRKLREIDRSGQQYFQPVESILTFASAWRAKARCNTDEDLQAIFDTLVTAAPQIAAVRIEPYGVFQEADFTDDPVRWTRPHVLEGPWGLGMSAYTPVDLPSGTRALVAVDVPLEEISRFTMAYDVTPRTRVLTMFREKSAEGDAKGARYAVLGLPREARFEDPEERRKAMLSRVRDLDLPYLEAALKAYPEQAPGRRSEPFSFESGGERWWGGFREYTLDGDVHMADAVFVPEQDLLGTSSRTRWIILGTAVMALGFAILMAFRLARRAGEPIEALVAGSERIRQGDFRAYAPIETPIVEVRRLAEAHEQMRAGLAELERIEHALSVARRVQEATFPSVMPALAGYRIHGHSRPAEDTGGDTYDVIGLRRVEGEEHEEITQGAADRAILLLADATGHGLGPALTVSEVRAMLRMAVRFRPALDRLVQAMNAQLRADLPAGRFVGVWLGHLDPARHRLTTFSAGQGPILVYRTATDGFEHQEADAPPLGLMDIEVVPPAPTELAPGDMYVVLSDGFHEAGGANGEQFGMARVEAVIRREAAAGPQAVIEALHVAVDSFTSGAPPDDDRTALIIQRT